MLKGDISHPFFFGSAIKRAKMLKPSILQINQINVIIFHQDYNLANISNSFKTSLKIPKGQSESVNQRRTDNTMIKKGQKEKHTHRAKDRATPHPLKTGGGQIRWSGRVSN